MLPGCN